MKSIRINRNSWFNRQMSSHMRMRWETLDFCSYCRKVMLFCGITVLLAALLMVSFFFTGNGILNAAVKAFASYSLVMKFVLSEMVGAVVITLFALLVYGFCKLLEYIFEKQAEKAWQRELYYQDHPEERPIKKPSIVWAFMISVSQKVCFKLDIVEE
jgi:Ni,Fe-hydrogenase I cytochrome b subunit